MTQRALMAFSLALLGWSLIKVLATGYYARQDTKGPVKVAMRSLGLTMVLNVIVLARAVGSPAISRSPGAHTLLALTNGVGAMFNAGLLYTGLARMGIVQPRPRHARPARAHRHRQLAAWRPCCGWLGGDLAFWLAQRHAEPRAAAERPDRGGIVVYFGVCGCSACGPGSSGCRPVSGVSRTGVASLTGRRPDFRQFTPIMQAFR